MKLTQAAEHVDGPVLVLQPGSLRSGRIVEVDHARRLVRVELRYGERGGYRWTGRYGWYAPCHLEIPQYAKQDAEGA